ncbi:Hypothetical Protein FCC1311_020502 [Hondaea fermentalgiana]|uniref:UBA domain-containing protein n=1 Tax=Hondaea fermentalgiana TaxID=2315210 RepID=A0A2R5GCF4_9STRA|nr:Hypothetical Protein FCC1311_020502 [Hondaea fermentalgiana]|eukprot:GBG25831.1 Hypothetical Protein FCC1311_020502 [Hondaea fermentalgiana]
MLRGRTEAKLVALQSLVESGASPEEVSAMAHRTMGEKSLVDALQHPEATLRILAGDPDETRMDRDKLLAACGGDGELASDLLHSAGGNIEAAMQLVVAQGGQDHEQRDEAVVDLTERRNGDNSDLDILVAKCGGDRGLATDIYENAGKDLAIALSLLS